MSKERPYFDYWDKMGMGEFTMLNMKMYHMLRCPLMMKLCRNLTIAEVLEREAA